MKDIGITIFDVGGIYKYPFKKIYNIAQNESNKTIFYEVNLIY